jgi:AcrR family transcriptional regulator
MSSEFVARLNKTFGNATMADVARRLKLPHATVRNYYQDRLPASDVLIKIANETGISLNWLLLGKGEMYAVNSPRVEIGTFLEERINDLIDRKIAEITSSTPARTEFAVRDAVIRLNDPRLVMSEWMGFEGKSFPDDYGVVFFNGWETFSMDERVEAVTDAKRALDRALKHT